jgi:hypothetical protein
VLNIPLDQVEANEGGYVTMCTTKHGGHLGWFEGSGDRLAKPTWTRARGPARRWVRRPILEWMKALNKIVDVRGESEQPRKCFVDQDGFITEEGGGYVAYKVLEGDGGFVKSGYKPKLYQGL